MQGAQTLHVQNTNTYIYTTFIIFTAYIFSIGLIVNTRELNPS